MLVSTGKKMSYKRFLLAPDLQSTDKIRGQFLVGFGIVLFNTTRVAQGCEGGIDGQVTEERRPCHSYQFGTIAGAKDLVALSVGSLEVSHVLDDSDDDAFELTNHVDALHDDHSGEHLRRRDDNDTVDRKRLQHSHRSI